MAHQADSIPWHILASKLRWAPGRVPSEIHALGLPSLPGKLKDCEGCECGVTNLHPISICPEDPDEDEFAKAFAQVVKDASKHKRAQYPENYSPPSPEDIILDDEIIQKIGPHASTWSDEMHDWSTIPSEQRVISAFQNTWINEDCHSFWERNETAFVNLEIVKTLLMFGDLDPILRACADPSVKLANWYSAAICSCAAPDIGWDFVHAKALSAYIALNVALCFPEICDPSAGRTDRTDYRHTGFYQYMLRQCTMSATSKATPYPHQRFFGIPDTHFDEFNTIDEEHWLCRTSIYDSAGFLYEDHYGLLSFDEFVNLESSLADEYQPMKPDVIFVQQLLFSKGLPAELMLEIMDLADYKEKRVLKVPHDPLHPANRAELNEYLDQCWQTIISCDILSDTLDMKAIDWQDRVHRGVKWLFHNPETLGYTLGTKCTVK